MTALVLAAVLLVPASWPSTEPARGVAGMPTALGPLPITSPGEASGALARSRPTLSGQATWYCRPHRSACTRGFPSWGHYAAACAPLRRLLGSAWRGRTVSVSRGGLTVRVRLIDHCRSNRRLVDLYGSVFDDFAPLSVGVIRVTIRG